MSTHDNADDELVVYVKQSSEFDIVPAQRSREWMLKVGANRCLPLLMASESGWWLRNRHAFSATWNGGPLKRDLSIAFDDTPPADNPTSIFGSGILTWGIGRMFRTPPGVDLLVRGPANLPKDGVTALEGLVETDWIEATFTMNWQLTRPGLSVRFEQGEPFAMVVPQGRFDLERYRPVIRPPSDAPELRDRVRRWSDRRERERVRRFAAEYLPEVIGGPEWDGSYMRGERDDGSRYEGHRVKRKLASFSRLDRPEVDTHEAETD